MLKPRKAKRMVAFRSPGDTDLLNQPKNYNFELRRLNEEKLKNRTIIALVLLSFIPIGLFIKNAESNFKKTQVKSMSARRRERLD